MKVIWFVLIMILSMALAGCQAPMVDVDATPDPTMVMTPAPTATPTAELPKVLDNEGNISPEECSDRQIYMMNTQDSIDEQVPNLGETLLSRGVKDFVELNLANNQYLCVKIDLYGFWHTILTKHEYKFGEKTIVEWANNSLVKQYDDFIMDFKEEFHDTDEYKRRYAGKDWDGMYREYLEEIANEQNNVYQIIRAYDNYIKAEEAYRNYIMEQVKIIYNEESNRLREKGLKAVLSGDASTYYCIKCELNRDEINSFPAGKYGYTISLFDKVDALDE